MSLMSFAYFFSKKKSCSTVSIVSLITVPGIGTCISVFALTT